MKLSVTLFVLIAFAVFKALILSGSISDLVIPNPSEVNIVSIDDIREVEDCNVLVLCLNSLVDIIFNIGVVIIFIFQIIFNIVILLVELVVLFVQVMFAEIPGIPDWLNLLLFTVPGVMIVVALIQLFKPSSAEE